MKVTRLPVDTGPAAWNALLEPPSPAVVLNTHATADCLVIGGGFAGLSAARRLKQLDPKLRIVLLDAKRIAEGPAGRNSGFMIDLPHELSSKDYATTASRDLSQIALNRQAIEFARSATEEYAIPPSAFDPCGKFNGAVTAATHQKNLAYAKHLEHLGEPCELLDAEQMKEVTGSDFYRSGLYTPGTVLLQPAQYTRGLAEGLANQVSVFENSPVVALEKEGQSWKATTLNGSVSAPKVILATNGHIECFGFFKREVFHVMLYASMTRALTNEENAASGQEKWGITPSDPAATTMRKFSDGKETRIITRNQMSYSPTMEISGSTMAKMADRHVDAFNKRYPHLKHVKQEYAWSGRLCMSRNSAPAFGELEDGLYAACCQNGLGTTRGTLAGMAAAEFAVKGKTQLVESLLEQGNPSKLPPAPLDTLGANAFMRWSEFKARKEL